VLCHCWRSILCDDFSGQERCSLTTRPPLLFIRVSAAPVHKSLFDTVKAACVAAGGEGVEEPEEEEVEEKAPVAKVEGAFGFIRRNPGMVACGASIIVFVLWRTVFSGSGPVDRTPRSSPDVMLLNNRIDALDGEIKAVRATLDEILAILKEKDSADS